MSFHGKNPPVICAFQTLLSASASFYFLILILSHLYLQYNFIHERGSGKNSAPFRHLSNRASRLHLPFSAHLHNMQTYRNYACTVRPALMISRSVFPSAFIFSASSSVILFCSSFAFLYSAGSCRSSCIVCSTSVFS